MKFLCPCSLKSKYWSVYAHGAESIPDLFFSKFHECATYCLDDQELEENFTSVSVSGSTAIIPIMGTMAKDVHPFFGNNTQLTRMQIEKAVSDKRISNILLRIDSGGGDFKGQMELTETIRAADQVKPVFAFIEDLGASAAYWAASSARKIFANQAAEVGSLGTFTVLMDASEMAAKEGLKLIVVSSGTLKGAGVFGTEISEEMIASVQDRVNEINEIFMGEISAARRIPRTRLDKIATGETFMAAKAKALGLIDQVTTFEAALTSISRTKQRTRGTFNEQRLKIQQQKCLE